MAPADAQPITLTVNGAQRTVTCDSDATLLEVLRDDLGLTGAKYGCGEGRCGACVVLMHGRPTPACITAATTATSATLLTVEGLAQGEGGALHPVQQAFLDTGALQCGYCTPGMVVAAVALLDENPRPSHPQIVAALQAHVCRCGVYGRIIAAVQLASTRMNGGATGVSGADHENGAAA